MYEYLKGKLAEMTPGKITLEVNGIGFGLLIPLNSYSKLPQLGNEVIIYTALIIREDAHTLFGFLFKNERDLFYKLNEVSGIGPKTALALVGHVEAADLQLAISQANISLLCKIPGIGKKTAERLVVDLRDVFKKQPLLEQKSVIPVASDAIGALTNLGYHPLQAQKAVQNVMKNAKDDIDLGTLITQALKVL